MEVGVSGNSGQHVAVRVDKGLGNGCDHVHILAHPGWEILVEETPQILERALSSLVQVWYSLCFITLEYSIME